MADITVIGGDYEATRQFLLSVAPKVPGLYALMKTVRTDEGRIFY